MTLSAISKKRRYNAAKNPRVKQTLLQAATEVSQALADYRLYSEKAELFNEQKEIQDKACRVVEEMSRAGKANYLELIKAQEKQLSARIGEAESRYKSREAVIMLYKALGSRD